MSLFWFYAIQPRSVLEDQVQTLSELEQKSRHIIKWSDLELLKRIGVERPLPDGFDIFHEDLIKVPDEEIKAAIDRHEDKLLTIISHYEAIGHAELRQIGMKRKNK